MSFFKWYLDETKDFWKIGISLLMLGTTLCFIWVTWKAEEWNRANAQALLTQSIAHERKMMGLELLIHFQTRYDKVAYENRNRILELMTLNKDTAVVNRMVKSYYSRYWDLQLEQYQAWRDTLLDISIYSTWMRWRRYEYERNDTLGLLNYQKGWTRFKTIPHLKDSEFVRFTNEVHNGNETVYINGYKKLKP